jgi:putative SOS response-associated peptidase YedK
VCGRYTLDLSELELCELFDLPHFPLTPRFNIAPTSQVPIVRAQAGEAAVVAERVDARWGLIPGWVREPADFKRLLFNARLEGAHERPSFRDALRTRRCVFPASGFYEWQVGPAGKEPRYIHPRDGGVLLLAGLWAVHEAPWGVSAAILTTAASPAIAPIHDRMPVVVAGDLWRDWIDPNLKDPSAFAQALAAHGEPAWAIDAVSRAVNRAGVDHPGLILPLPPGQA